MIPEYLTQEGVIFNEIKDLISEKKFERAKIMLAESVASENDFTSMELRELLEPLYSQLNQTSRDIFLLKTYAQLLFENHSYAKAAEVLKHTLTIFNDPELNLKLWDCYKHDGQIRLANDYGEKYLIHLFRFKRQKMIDSFLSKLIVSGLERKKVNLYNLIKNIYQGNIEGFKTYFSEISKDAKLLEVDVASEILKKRKYWKKHKDIEASLFFIYRNLMPVDSSEEEIIKRQLLEIILSEILLNGRSEKAKSFMSFYTSRYSVRFENKESTATPVGQDNTATLFHENEKYRTEINFLIDARELTSAKDYIQDLYLKGVDTSELERLERRIRIQEESDLRDITVIKESLLQELSCFSEYQEETNKIEQEQIETYFDKKLEELDGSFSFAEARNLLQEMTLFNQREGYGRLISICRERYDDLSEEDQLELEYFNILKLFEDKNYIAIIDIIEKIIRHKPLVHKDKMTFLLLKKRAYKRLKKFTKMDDVDRAINLLLVGKT